jgi:hypothetical protein
VIKTISESDIIKITRKDLGKRDFENKKQGARKELERLEKAVFNLENGKVGELIDNPEFDYKYYIHKRLKELEEVE